MVPSQKHLSFLLILRFFPFPFHSFRVKNLQSHIGQPLLLIHVATSLQYRLDGTIFLRICYT